MTSANGQKLNVHHGDTRWCKSCKKEQYHVCWNFSTDYQTYLDEDGSFPPSVWNNANIDIENGVYN